MTTMHISLPDSLKEWVEEQVSKKGYSTTSEYIREVLRKEQTVDEQRAEIEEKLLKAIDGPFTEVTPEYWKNLRARLKVWVENKSKK